MAQTTLTSKGQVTIPKEIRETLKLHSGDRIEIVVTANREAVIRPVSKTVDDLYQKLHKPDRKAVSLDEMNEAVREKVRDKFK